jgi:sec-independent protein translocase protein TatB
MFDFGFSEIVLTSAIALIVLGPEKLPKVARQVGNWMGRARSMARQLTEQLEREVDADDLLKQTKQSRTNSATTNSTTPYGSTAPGMTNTPVSVPTPAAPLQAVPEPTYSAHPDSPPHGADWHPAPPETKSSDG